MRIAISGNLCRCTGYQGIVLAALDAAKRTESRTGLSLLNSSGGQVTLSLP